jgi:signal transduction histidine kinase
MYSDPSSGTPIGDAERRLVLGERLATIGRLAAVLAHEIRTPLTSIGGFARRVLARTPVDDPRHEELEIIVEEVERVERIIEEVLGYTRLSSPAYSPSDVNAEIVRLLAALQDEFDRRSLRLVLALSPDIPPILVDIVQISQAVTNLVVNAMEAMSGKGTLTVSTELQGAFVEIVVSDTGCGIAAEHYEKLFSPFFTTKVTGTGLGLPVVAQVVQNHYGSVTFESLAGTGTAFRVRLPVVPPKEAGRQPPG